MIFLTTIAGFCSWSS